MANKSYELLFSNAYQSQYIGHMFDSALTQSVGNTLQALLCQARWYQSIAMELLFFVRMLESFPADILKQIVVVGSYNTIRVTGPEEVLGTLSCLREIPSTVLNPFEGLQISQDWESLRRMLEELQTTNPIQTVTNPYVDWQQIQQQIAFPPEYITPTITELDWIRNLFPITTEPNTNTTATSPAPQTPKK